MFSEHVKFTTNMVGEEIAKWLAKFSQNSKYQLTTIAIAHPTVPSSSATPSTSVTQPSYGMPLNYFSRQTPLSYNTSMKLHTPEPVPISSTPPTSAIPGQTSIVPPLVPMGAGSNTTTGVRYTTPHAPQAPPTDRLNKTTTRIWEGVEARLREWGLVPLVTESIKNRIRVSSIWLHIPRVGVSLILLSLMVRVIAPHRKT
jgi:hypothetical protein